MAKYRILSLDGGGAWALLQVMALQQIYGEQASGREVLKEFDLVAANSGGSIVLGGLIENKRLDELIQDYFLSEARRRQIFAELSFFEAPVSGALRAVLGIAPKYSAKRKLVGLETVLEQTGKKPLSILASEIAQENGNTTNFLILGFDYDRQRATFFRSNTGSNAASGAAAQEPTLAEAIHASSNAPVNYFDAPAEACNRRFWDGAIGGYNNPILAGLIEALTNGQAASDIAILSIGTGSVVLPLAHLLPRGDRIDEDLTQKKQDSTLVKDLTQLASSILDDPPDAASFITHVLLTRNTTPQGVPLTGPVVRMSPLVQPERDSAGRWSTRLDRADFKALAKLDMDAVQQEEVLLIQRLGEAWIKGMVPNQAIRANGTTLACEIGWPTFATAKQAWLDLGSGPHGAESNPAVTQTQAQPVG